MENGTSEAVVSDTVCCWSFSSAQHGGHAHEGLGPARAAATLQQVPLFDKFSFGGKWSLVTTSHGLYTVLGSRVECPCMQGGEQPRHGL